MLLEVFPQRGNNLRVETERAKFACIKMLRVLFVTGKAWKLHEPGEKRSEFRPQLVELGGDVLELVRHGKWIVNGRRERQGLDRWMQLFLPPLQSRPISFAKFHGLRRGLYSDAAFGRGGLGGPAEDAALLGYERFGRA
jgi:hypothetical protein